MERRLYHGCHRAWGMLSGVRVPQIMPDLHHAPLLLGMVSFQPVLAGLGLKCQFVEDQAATDRLRERVRLRNGSYVRADATHVVLTFRFMQKIGRLGAQARVDNSTKAQRQEWARQAAIARWRKP